MGAAKRQLGFTLLEVQVALLVTALVLGLAYGGLYLAGRSWHAVEAAAARSDAQRGTATLLRKLLGATTPLLWHQRGKPARLIFTGTKRHLHLVSTLPAHQGGGGLHLLRLEVRAQTLQLGHLEATPALRPFASDVSQRMQWIPLIEEVTSLSIDYYGNPATDRDETPAWHRDWREAARLPHLVRLRIRSAQTDKSQTEWVLPVRSEAKPGPFHLNLHAADYVSS